MICGPGEGRIATSDEEGEEVSLMRKKKQKVLARRKMSCWGRGRRATGEAAGKEEE